MTNVADVVKYVVKYVAKTAGDGAVTPAFIAAAAYTVAAAGGDLAADIAGCFNTWEQEKTRRQEATRLYAEWLKNWKAASRGN